MTGHPPNRRSITLRSAAAVVSLLGALATSPHAAQSGPVPEPSPVSRTHVTIPYLANASRPNDLDYAAAECDVADEGLTMRCRFRQVFITPVSFDASTCAITSNGYELTFRRASTTLTRWTSEDAPQGACGVVETHTLDDGGGTRWTLTITSEATAPDGGSACPAGRGETLVYDWRTMKRALPCSRIQPGAIER